MAGSLQVPPQNTPLWDKRPEDPPELRRLFSAAWWNFFSGLAGKVNGFLGLIRYGTHEERLALRPSDLANGTVFIETDRNGVEYQYRGGLWVYAGGIYDRTQSQLAALGATLTTNDVGFLVEVTDYRHTLQWSGTAWTWGPGDAGSGMIQAFAVDPNPTTGWQLCDGTANVPYLKADGTTATFTTPDLAGTPAYLKLAGSIAGPTAANAPTLTNPTVASATTGLTVDAASTGVSDNASATGISTGVPSATATVQVGVGATVASSTHTHGITDPTHVHTINDPTHTHTVTDPQHSHSLTGGSVGADGEPRHYNLKAWFRK